MASCELDDIGKKLSVGQTVEIDIIGDNKYQGKGIITYLKLGSDYTDTHVIAKLLNNGTMRIFIDEIKGIYLKT